MDRFIFSLLFIYVSLSSGNAAAAECIRGPEGSCQGQDAAADYQVFLQTSIRKDHENPASGLSGHANASVWDMLGAKDVLGASDEGRVLCRIATGGGDHATVKLASDNRRTLQFDGDLGKFYESQVFCAGSASSPSAFCKHDPCAAPAQEQKNHLQEPRKYISKICAEKRVPRIFLVGLGLGDFAINVKKWCPGGMFIDAIEPSQPVIHLARMYGALSDPALASMVNAIQLPMEQAVKDAVAHGKQYDLVYVDCFDGDGIPEGCRGESLFSSLASMTNVVIQNALNKESASSIAHQYKQTSAFSKVSSIDYTGNYLVLADHTPTPASP